MKTFTLAIVIEKDADGYYAECPALQGCYSQGQTYEEVIANIRDAVQLNLQDRLENGEPLELPEMVSMTTLEIVA